MAGERLSVIISNYSGVEGLERCLRAAVEQRLPPDQLVVVDDGSLRAAPGLESGLDCPVIRVPAAPGVSASRNAAAYAADGEVLVFIDGRGRACPGWAAALRRAFAAGASLAGGAIKPAGARSGLGCEQSGPRRHDQDARNGFLPYVSGAHLAIRRDVFVRLGGFDELSSLSEDVELSLRAQLAGYPIAFVPEAEVVYESVSSFGGLLRERFQRARADRMTERRFRRFPFMRIEPAGGVTQAFTSSAAALLTSGAEGEGRRLSMPLLDAVTTAATRLGTLATDLELALGLVPLPLSVDYRDPEQHNTSSPLPGPPAFLLLGDDRLVMTLLRLACDRRDQLIVAPPGLEREPLARWDQPAPWSLRLARTAVRAGWPLVLGTAALRVEREQPRTWGEAFLTLHRVHAWAHGRPRFGLAALGPDGRELAARLPDVPIVIAGDREFAPERVAIQVTRRRLLHDRQAVGAQLSRLFE